MKEIDPLVDASYKFVAQRQQQRSDQGLAAKDKWHLSFHGSQFPGDYTNACGRQAMYRMMDLPRPLMMRWLEQVADAGKDLEDRLVMKWYFAGHLLSTPPFRPDGTRQNQDVYTDRKHWLTSTVDAIVCWPEDEEGIVAEVKSKDDDVITSMKRLVRGPDPKHVLQVKCQIGLAHEAGQIKRLRCYNTGRFAIDARYLDLNAPEGTWICPQHEHDKCLQEVTIEAPTRGYVYYVSRGNPDENFEFLYEYDPDFMRLGRAKLAAWRKSFLANELPQTNFEDKRFAHPFGWQWTKPQYPCSRCDYGSVCRADNIEAIKNGKKLELTESAGVVDAPNVRPLYDAEDVRAEVLNFWKAINHGAEPTTADIAA